MRGGKRDAQKALASLVVEVEQVGAAASGTFADLVERWFEQRRADWSPSNMRETRRIIDTKLHPLLELRLDRVTTAAIDRFYAGLRAQGGADGGPLGAASVQRIHTVVRAALEQGVAWGWVSRNPAAHARPGRVDTVEVAPPGRQDVVRLLEAAERDDPDFAFFLILAGVTGARRGELCALRDSDFDGDVVTISRVLALGPEGPVEQHKRWRNKGRGRRVALAGDDAADVRGAARAPTPPSRRVRDRPARRCLRVLFGSGRIPTVAARVGVPAIPVASLSAGAGEVRLHDLRHFMVSSLLDAGIALPTVAGRAGHADGGRTTLSVYGHRIDESDRMAAEVMERLLVVGQDGLIGSGDVGIRLPADPVVFRQSRLGLAEDPVEHGADNQHAAAEALRRESRHGGCTRRSRFGRGRAARLPRQPCRWRVRARRAEWGGRRSVPDRPSRSHAPGSVPREANCSDGCGLSCPP